jgi:hypothetical protein
VTANVPASVRASAVIAACTIASIVAAHAQPMPSARRIYLLCQMEDLSCGTLLQKAYDDFLADQTWTTCYPDQHYAPDGARIGPSCRNVTYTCEFIRQPQLNLDQIYAGYMQTMVSFPSLSGDSAHHAMYMTMVMLHRCK